MGTILALIVQIVGFYYFGKILFHGEYIDHTKRR